MKKIFLRFISCILVSIMLVISMPVAAISQVMEAISSETEEAAQANKNYNDMLELPPEGEEVYIVAEDTSKRGEFEKHYICSDGTFVAVTYPEAVHYRGGDGEWTDIDNSLTLNSANGTYEAQNGDFKVSFNNAVSNSAELVQQSVAETAGVLKPVSSDKLISLRKGDKTLSWTIKANKGTPAASAVYIAHTQKLSDSSAEILGVDNAVRLTVKGEIKTDAGAETSFVKKNVNDKDAFTLSKVSNKVQYDSIFGADEGVSVRYTTYRNKIKEDIIISKETDIKSFSMSVDNSGLLPRLNGNGSVDFLDENGNSAYHVGAPYMTDAAYASTYDIDVRLTVSGGMCIITYTPDETWMKSPDREYPIILDPYVSTSEYGSNVYDTYVSPYRDENNSGATELYIHNGQAAILSFKDLPQIHSSMPISSAKIVANLMFGQLSQTPLYIETFNTEVGIENMRYADYASAEKTMLSTSFAFEGNPRIGLDISSAIYNLYRAPDDTKFAIRAETSSGFCYPIRSSELPSGEGPALLVYYGYRLPEGLQEGDAIALQNVYDGEYVVPYNADEREGTDIVTEKADNTYIYSQFVLLRDNYTEGVNLRYAPTKDGYLTVGDDWDKDDIENDIILSYEYIPEKQDWLIIGAENNTFDIVLRSDTRKHLTVVSYGYVDPEICDWVEEYTNLEIAYATPKIGGGYNCSDTNQQRWRIYKDGNMVSSEAASGVIETGTYYINNVAYGGFLAEQSYTKLIMKSGLVSSLGNDIRWQITNVGENEYVFKLVNSPDMYLYCTSSGDVGYRQRSSTITYNDVLWEIEKSSANNNFYNIRHKATGRYIYYDGDKVVTDTSPTNYVNHRWRIVNRDDYVQVSDNSVSFSDITIPIGSASAVDIELFNECSLATRMYDFEYTVTSGADKININSYGDIKALAFGTATVKAIHKTTKREFSFNVEVIGPATGKSFIKNRETDEYVFPADKQYVIRDTRFFEGDTGNAWEIIYNGDGYYKIKNNDEEKYLTAAFSNRENETIVKLPWHPTYASNQLWKFTKLPNGAYKIQAKSHEGTDLCLSIPTNTLNRYVHQKIYTDDDDYGDEWWVKNIAYAYSTGGDFYNGMDVIDANESWKKCGYISSYNINPTADALNYNNLNSEIVYFSSHGTQHSLELPNNIYLSDGKIACNGYTFLIGEKAFTNARLYIYDACLTAGGIRGSDNLCQKTYASGVECVIGWNNSIPIADSRQWQTRFQNRLVAGDSVRLAADYANSFYYNENTSIKSYRIYGNEDLTINEEDISNSLAETDTKLKLTNIPYPNHSESAIKNVLANNFTTFSNGSAKITVTYTDFSSTDYVIDYYYLNNGFSTSSGYSIIVHKGVITQIRDNTSLQSYSMRSQALYSAPIVTQSVIETANVQATLEMSKINPDYVVTEQIGDNYYDLENGKYYYRVKTVYMTPGDAYGAIITLYEL